MRLRRDKPKHRSPNIKTSYSQSSTYKLCSQHWHYKYNEKIDGQTSGASLFFGTAVDSAIMDLLAGKTDYLETFEKLWYVQSGRDKKETIIFNNPHVIFAHNDFDADVLLAADLTFLQLWLEERNLQHLGQNPILAYKAVAKIKKNPYKRPTTEEMGYFNIASWVSLKRKGILMIKSFVDQFYPKIDKVLATQKFSFLKDDESGDMIQGVVDAVLLLKNHTKPIIFDLKTASRPYTQEQIDNSEQLTLYAAMEGGRYKTDQVGYIVLSKAINKERDSFCLKCGHKKDGRHKTCNNKIDGVRCGGSWEEKLRLEPHVQVLIQTKTEEQINALLNDHAAIINAMKNKVVFKNTNQCESWFGNPCVYYNLCHKNDMSGLVKRS